MMANIVFDFLHNYETGERRESEPASAYQFDEGHVIEAILPEAVTSCEVHYWIRGQEKSAAYTPGSITVNDDRSCTVTCNVPNLYFETNGELRVYIVVTDGDASITTYEGYVHVCQRSMPDDYVDDDPDNEATRVLTEARDAAQTATQQAQSASASAEQAQQSAETLSGSVAQIATNTQNITQLQADTTTLKDDIQYSQNKFNDNFSLLLYGETVTVKSFVQGDRSSSDPYTPTQNLFRITIAYPIKMRKGDKLTISCPSGKKIDVVTSTGYSSGFKTADYTMTASANFDAFIIMANSDTSTTITPADGIAAEMTLTYTDNMSRLTSTDKAIAQLENNSGFFIDKSQISVPGYTVNNGRIYSSSSDTKRSDFIKVMSGTKIAYRLSGIASFNLISFYTDKSATSTSAPSYVSGVAGEAAGRYTQGIFTVPEDGYLVFTNMNAYEDIYIGNIDGLYGIDKRIDNLEQSTGVADLTGRYILNFGDSLANGAGNKNKSYADMIADETGATFADYSVGGTPFANYGSTTSYACVRNQVRQAISDHSAHDVAICFIEGGINDLKRNVLDLGTLSDNFDGTYTENMIIGSAENIFYSLKNAFPAAKIVFVMYHQMPLTTSKLTETQMHQRQEQEHDAFASVCKKWAIPLADIYADGGINSNIEAMANAYFGVNADEKFGRDIAHPNAFGYRKFYVPLIKQKLGLSTYE